MSRAGRRPRPPPVCTPKATGRDFHSSIINVAFTIVAIRLLDKAGRRTMLMIGVSGMVISLVALGGAFVGGGGSTVASVVAILSLMCFVAGLGTMANWTFNFIVSLTFLLLIEALGRAGAFWFYAAIGVLTLWFCWKYVPETKGKPLEEIEAEFEARTAAKAKAPVAPGPAEPVG